MTGPAHHSDPHHADPHIPTHRVSVPHALRASRILPIGRFLEPAVVAPIGRVLLSHGFDVFELTMNSDGALDGIAALAELGMCVGAGTVLTEQQASDAMSAGAEFLVSPHTDPSLVAFAASRGVPFFPGAFTPTEVLAGWRAGAAAVKVFPASLAGPATVRELRGPFPEIEFLATGGLTAASVVGFLDAGCVAVGVGGWLLGSGRPDQVGERAAELRRVVRARDPAPTPPAPPSARR